MVLFLSLSRIKLDRSFVMEAVNHRLWGQVFDIESIPASSVQIQFYSGQDKHFYQTQANDQGKYSVDLPSGSYAVTARVWSGINRAPAISLGTVELSGDRQHDFRTASTAVAESPAGPLPDRMELEQNYPNPFNSTTTFRFVLASEGEATLAVYNLLGQRVRMLADGRLVAGASVVAWDGKDDHGRDLATGAYVYRLETGGQVLSRKLLLLK